LALGFATFGAVDFLDFLKSYLIGLSMFLKKILKNNFFLVINMIERPYFLRIVQIMTNILEDLPYRISKYLKKFKMKK